VYAIVHLLLAEFVWRLSNQRAQAARLNSGFLRFLPDSWRGHAPSKRNAPQSEGERKNKKKSEKKNEKREPPAERPGQAGRTADNGGTPLNKN